MKGFSGGQQGGGQPAVTIGLWTTGAVAVNFENAKGEKVGVVRWALELISLYKLVHVMARADTDEEKWQDAFPLVFATVAPMPAPSVVMAGVDPLGELGAEMRDAFFKQIGERVQQLIARDEAKAEAIAERDRAVADAMRDLAATPEETPHAGEPPAESVSSEGAQRSGN